MGAFRRTLAAFRKQQEESRKAQDPDRASQLMPREAVGQEDGAGSEEEIGKEGRRRAEKKARSCFPSPPVGAPGSHGAGHCRVHRMICHPTLTVHV